MVDEDVTILSLEATFCSATTREVWMFLVLGDNHKEVDCRRDFSVMKSFSGILLMADLAREHYIG